MEGRSGGPEQEGWRGHLERREGRRPLSSLLLATVVGPRVLNLERRFDAFVATDEK